MEIIQLSGYTSEEKFHIAKEHLVPKQIKEHGFLPEKIELTDDVLKSIITDYTREAGVRDLQRKIAKVMRSVSERVIRNADQEKFIIDTETVEEILGNDKNTFELAQKTANPGVVTGLAWTPVGGDILFIESAMMPGTGKIQLTGKLGDVMMESAHIGLSLVRSKLSKIVPDFNFAQTDFHIHVPSGSIPKDGPSAGITIFIALCSLIFNKTVDPQMAMTGEITLRGAVLPVGGIKEKLIAAHRSGIKKIVMSKRNEKDLKDVPEIVKKEIKFYFVENINELMLAVFGVWAVPSFGESLTRPAYIENFSDKNENSLR
jgi:ATP-dependent Lon protease